MQAGTGADDETLLSAGELPTRASGSPLRRGDTLGRYVVLSQLGEGGMGIVYSCYDPELNRKLAIKLLRAHSGGGDTRALAAEQRLLREAQAMAQLSHTNVVSVHDVGTHDGDVYVAMEFVDCVTLREWSTAQVRSHQEVVSVFLEAGKGLVAAHGKGLVHRDFKPDNVLVAHDGRVLVTDFGLARAMEEGPIRGKTGESVLDSEGARHHWTPNEDALNNELTQVGAIMGTPAYMAPEQHAGLDTDARADQFSFCVAMFEALYGQKPFQGRSLAALALAASSGDVTEPENDHGVPRWLDAAVRKGMSTSPGNRHPSMEALLEALQANPRAARRPLWFALGVVGVLAAGITTMQVAEARTRSACESQSDGITRVWRGQRVSALTASMGGGDQRRVQTLGRITPWLDGYAKAWKTTALSTCEDERVHGSLSPELGEEARICLNERADALDALVSGMEEADARGLYSLLESVAELPRIEDCSDPGHLAARSALPEDAAKREDVVAARRELAGIRAQRAVADVEGASRRVDQLSKKADEIDYAPLVAQVRYEAGRVDMDAGLPREAVKDFQASMAAALRAGLDPIAAGSAGWLARAMGNNIGKKEEGLAWGEMGWALHARSGLGEELVAAELAVNVGLVHHAAVELDETEALYRRALKIRRELLGPSHPQIALVINNLANIYWARAEWEEGLRLHAESLAMRRSMLGPEHPAVASSYNNIGLIEHDRGNYEAAIENFQRSVDIGRAAYGDEHRLVGLSSGNIGMSLEALGRFEEALAAYAKAVEVASKTVPPGSPLILEPQRGQARVALMLGRVGEAAKMLEGATRDGRENMGADHPDLAGAECELADVYLEQGKVAEAVKLLEAAYPNLVKAYGVDNPRIVRQTLIFARTRIETGDREGARELLGRATTMLADLPADGLEALERTWLEARVEASDPNALSSQAAALRPRIAALGPNGRRLSAQIGALAPQVTP